MGLVVAPGGKRAGAAEIGAGREHCSESRGSGQASRGRADILGSESGQAGLVGAADSR